MCRGESKTRVSTISRSDGRVTFNVPVFFIISDLSFWSSLSLRASCHRRQQLVEPGVTGLDTLRPVGLECTVSSFSRRVKYLFGERRLTLVLDKNERSHRFATGPVLIEQLRVDDPLWKHDLAI